METTKATQTLGDEIYFYVGQIPAFILSLCSLVPLAVGHRCTAKDRNQLKPWAHPDESKVSKECRQKARAAESRKKNQPFSACSTTPC